MFSPVTCESDPSLARYRDVRAAGQSMATKVIKAGESLQFDIFKAARALGLPTPGRVLVFDGEADMAALWDFYLAEFRVQGRTLVDRCDSASADLTPPEAAHLEAFRRGRTSLFLAVRVLPRECQVVLRDVLEPQQPEVFLTDINLSQSFQRIGGQALLFFRVLAVEGISMSSGMFLLFRPDYLDRLVQSFHQKMKKVVPADWSERKYVFFYEKYRQFGERQAYADVAL